MVHISRKFFSFLFIKIYQSTITLCWNMFWMHVCIVEPCPLHEYLKKKKIIFNWISTKFMNSPKYHMPQYIYMHINNDSLSPNNMCNLDLWPDHFVFNTFLCLLMTYMSFHQHGSMSTYIVHMISSTRVYVYLRPTCTFVNKQANRLLASLTIPPSSLTKSIITKNTHIELQFRFY